eukprot:SAG31_NODE_1355_length_8661_cov_3.130343_5_plen_150_part_00
MGTRLTPEFLFEVVAKKTVGNVRDGLLKKTTHVNLEEKGIEKIESLEVCEHIRVLYLFDNAIQKIENLSFATTLTHLYLQNNLISSIEGLDSCQNLSKLYLDGNQIGCVEGLHSLARLEELSLNRQVRGIILLSCVQRWKSDYIVFPCP